MRLWTFLLWSREIEVQNTAANVVLRLLGATFPDEANRTDFALQTMIEAHVDVKTTDGYLLRLFCVGFTKKRNNQIRKTSYAQHQQVRQIRKKMMEIMTREVQTNDLKEVVNKL